MISSCHVFSFSIFHSLSSVRYCNVYKDVSGNAGSAYETSNKERRIFTETEEANPEVKMVNSFLCFEIKSLPIRRASDGTLKQKTV